MIWLVLTVFVLLGYSLQSVAGSVHYSLLMQAYGTVSSPPVILQKGNCSGTTTIYTNNTSALVTVKAPTNDSATFDHVLKVVNQAADNWQIKLKVYANSTIGRLSSLNISLYDGASSNQIAVSGGSIVKSEGTWYDLPGGSGSTVKISMNNLQATTTGTSYLYVYLKIQVPNTSTYILYVITFEIN